MKKLSVDDFISTVSAGSGLARPNLYQVILPTDIPGVNIDREELNILCKNVSLPGRQITTVERLIGPKYEKMPYGFAVEDISLTFYVTNKYAIKEYFEAWQNLVFDQSTYEVNYKVGPGGYARDVEIHHLAKRVSGIQRAYNDVKIDDINAAKSIYKVVLEEAFPTTLNSIELSNDLNGLTELNVQLSYTNWRTK